MKIPEQYEQLRMGVQLSYMRKYLDILKARIEAL
jgi:hypothetical protein